MLFLGYALAGLGWAFIGRLLPRSGGDEEPDLADERLFPRR